MALATRPKPKVHHKKRQARHHRLSKPYLKTYWPYLPMLAVVGLGYLANQHWPAGLVKLDNVQATTRVEALSGDQNSWSLAFIIAIAGVAAAVFIVRHWYRVHRAINRGELFLVHHPWLDIGLVFVATAGVILTRAAV